MDRSDNEKQDTSRDDINTCIDGQMKGYGRIHIMKGKRLKMDD